MYQLAFKDIVENIKNTTSYKTCISPQHKSSNYLIKRHKTRYIFDPEGLFQWPKTILSTH